MILGKKFDKKYFTSDSYADYKKDLKEWVVIPTAKKIYGFLKEKPASKILDVGCGFGDLIAELQDKYKFSVAGPCAIKQACPSGKTKIKDGSILKLSFKKNNFDAVICFDVVCYLAAEDIVKAVKNLIDVSRGYIFFSSIYRHSIYASQKHNPDSFRKTTMSLKEYINLFSRNGARFIKKFHGKNGGDIMVFKK
jgi:2-polyprenyl-3-methyl-5-hydroxy-6-metoxy-1,4-benzoquinol methylase